jgi:flagellar secretion chaperone FliS
MSYAQRSTRYREMEVLSASPGQLVVILYDHLLASLRRARLAIEGNNFEQRVAYLDKSRAAVTELLVTLDQAKGGAIATNLSSLYSWILSELLDIGLRPDVQRLDKVIGIAGELRDAFAQIADAAAMPQPVR